MDERKPEKRIETSRVWEFLNDQTIRIPEIIVYTEEDFNGIEFRTNCDVVFVGDRLNEKIKSIVVVCGIWEFYKFAEFSRGNLANYTIPILLKPGYYNNWDSNETEFSIKDISSFKCIIP